MTQTLKQSEATIVIGRKIRDCGGGQVFTIWWVDSDGDYVIGHDGEYWIVAEPSDVHDKGRPHLIAKIVTTCSEHLAAGCNCEAVCYTWETHV